MREQLYVNLLGEWHRLEQEDYFEDLLSGEWLTSKDLNAIEDDFLKLTIKRKNKAYILHKSQFAFVIERAE